MNEFGIDNKIWIEIINALKNIPEVKKAILFGSRAKGTYKNTSDIDLAVEFIDSNKKLLLIRKLDEIRCILKFDVLDINKIQNEKLINNINNDGIIIFERH